ncbi:MAG: methyltransferase domain-containing protein [Terriglobia bacterium]|jgi:2-polyprenyl-3-methyl-5-hydroxy-6-metoxy-1,4-benzoquinol methylase|nr:methyltransferase domain-containing protein [Terriglobia bacterium]
MRTALFHESAHLPESKLSPPLVCCVICGAEFTRNPVAKLQDSPDVFLLRCPKCYACSGSRLPTESALIEYYSNYYRKPGPKVTHDCSGRFGRHVASFIGEPRRDVAITDFGGGEGRLAYSLAQILAERGCTSVEITVIDYAECVATQDPRISIKAQRPGAPIPPSDVIVASAVLEHLTDPLGSLTQLFGALNRDGVLYVRTPAVAGILEFATVLGRKLDFTFPAHIHDFGQRFWENVLNIVPEGSRFEVLHSAPSLVETDLRHHPWHTLAACVAKAPWRLLGNKYTLVGGWEIVFRRK